MAKKKTNVSTKEASKPVSPAKPELAKPVIAFYRNNAKSGWQMFPKVCFNKEVAKERIKVQSGSDIIKFIDVPEDLQN